MENGSDVRYALSDKLHIAYRTFGKGPVDLLFVPPWISNLDAWDDNPIVMGAFERLSSFSRLITLDRRGTGLSDRLSGLATLEEGMDDLIAILDAEGIERAGVMGWAESGPLAAMFAATHPTRVQALLLYGTYATTTWKPDYPWGQTEEDRATEVAAMIATWGTGVGLAGLSEGPGARWFARLQRGAASKDALPGVFATLAKTDVTHVLETITVPTLVMHRREDGQIPVENGRYLASKIPTATYVELEGMFNIPFLGDWEAVAGEMEEFLTGDRRAPSYDRVLATVLFTDIVGSTDMASSLGDHKWRELLDAHDRVAARHVARHNGKLIKTTGDGLFATFDGPARAIRCAAELASAVDELGLQIRTGLHAGEVELRGSDVGGIAVHIGARVAKLADPGEVLVSGAIPPLVAGSGITFEDRGSHELKGVDGEWRVFAARGA
ncbi:MAG TPA: adenylate/guanylate cyclase domain-containing protein [Actinomycetota bacterium]|nr:adenylate/guanylate cyclase domain-containing protein [Actinomycetota bacterium]